MKWIKHGKIFDHNSFDIKWFKKNAMRPLPFLISEDVLRVFVTFCDENNVGRIGYVDLSSSNPKKILGFSRKPVLDIGEPGTFDDNGVTTGCVIRADGSLYLFYSGFQLGKKIPYMIFSGIAVSKDNGDNFVKLEKEVPLLDRVPTEKNFRCVPYVIQQGSVFRMWYLADCLQKPAWVVNDAGKMQPRYSARYLESRDLFSWGGIGRVVLDFSSEDEHGLCVDSIWQEGNLYKCIYSIRSKAKGYRLGYAESVDGIHFNRMDDKLNLDVSSGEFDSEMMCYAKLFEIKDKKYLFYSGNGYGTDGIGYAELVG